MVDFDRDSYDHHVRVLIVDDSAGVRARFRALLAESSGIEICEASDAEQALCASASKPFDVAIVDVHLRRRDGLTLLSRIAEDPRVVIVVLTNEASAQHRKECLRRGARFFFDKSRQFARAVQVVGALAGNAPEPPLSDD